MKNELTKKLIVLLLAAFAIGLTGCQCINVPAQDSTRPRAAMTIIYRENAPGFPERTVTITSNELGDPPVLRIPSRAFQVLYSGNDDGGVRTLTAEYNYLDSTSVTNPDGSISQGLIAVPGIPNGDFSSCAKTTRVLSFDWQMLGRASLKVTAVDFHGNQSSTRTLKIRPS